MTYKTEFPDFGSVDHLVAQLPATFEDQSHHNDMCPKWANDEYEVLIDYEKVEDREVQEIGARFMVLRVGEPFVGVLDTDDWSEVIELIRNL